MTIPVWLGIILQVAGIFVVVALVMIVVGTIIAIHDTNNTVNITSAQMEWLRKNMIAQQKAQKKARKGKK